MTEKEIEIVGRKMCDMAMTACVTYLVQRGKTDVEISAAANALIPLLKEETKKSIDTVLQEGAAAVKANVSKELVMQNAWAEFRLAGIRAAKKWEVL